MQTWRKQHRQWVYDAYQHSTCRNQGYPSQKSEYYRRKNDESAERERESERRKVIIFGGGQIGELVYNRICKTYDVIAFCDNHEKKQGTTLFNLPIIAPNKLLEMEYDNIFIGADARDSIYRQVVDELGLSPHILLDEPMKLAAYNARRMALRGVKELVDLHRLNGNVAEAGVFQGEFAKDINAAFPDRTLYLFDTFEGFDKRDVLLEEPGVGALEKEFNISTSADYVLGLMPHKEQCVAKAGYFPDSAIDVDDSFVFVSLDLDLYKPTLDGLKFFYPRLVTGGYIFVHDFFSARFTGVKKAVFEYCKNEKLSLSPLGDECSVIVVK